MITQTKIIGNVKTIYKNGNAVSGIYLPKPNQIVPALKMVK